MKNRQMLLMSFLTLFVCTVMAADQIVDLELESVSQKQTEKTFVQEVKNGLIESVKFTAKWAIPALIVYVYIIKPTFIVVQDFNKNFSDLNNNINQLMPEVKQVNNTILQVVDPIKDVANAAVGINGSIEQVAAPLVITIGKVGNAAEQIGNVSEELQKSVAQMVIPVTSAVLQVGNAASIVEKLEQPLVEGVGQVGSLASSIDCLVVPIKDTIININGAAQDVSNASGNVQTAAKNMAAWFSSGIKNQIMSKMPF